MENNIVTSERFGKAEILSIVNKAVACVQEGEVDALSVYLQCKALSKIAEDTMKAIEGSAIVEAEKFGKNAVLKGNVHCDMVESGVKYSYEHSADWQELQTKINALKEHQKLVENALKVANPTTPYLDKATGEFIEYPAPKQSKTTIKVTFK